MYIVGHCYVAEKSRVFPPHYPSAQGIGLLMLPDYVNCHDWGYEHYKELTGQDGMLVRAHLVTDWLVHFGTLDVRPRQRRGWAYRRMGLASTFYDEFFKLAFDRHLSNSPEPKDSMRGFSHSMIEYCIDSAICRRGWFDSRFGSAVTEALQALNFQTVQKILEELSIVVSNENDLQTEIASYAARIIIARDPEDLVLLAAARKFGLQVTTESAQFVRGFISRLLEIISNEEIDHVCEECSIAVTETCIWPNKTMS